MILCWSRDGRNLGCGLGWPGHRNGWKGHGIRRLGCSGRGLGGFEEEESPQGTTSLSAAEEQMSSAGMTIPPWDEGGDAGKRPLAPGAGVMNEDDVPHGRNAGSIFAASPPRSEGGQVLASPSGLEVRTDLGAGLPEGAEGLLSREAGGEDLADRHTEQEVSGGECSPILQWGQGAEIHVQG